VLFWSKRLVELEIGVAFAQKNKPCLLETRLWKILENNAELSSLEGLINQEYVRPLLAEWSAQMDKGEMGGLGTLELN